MSAPGGFAWVAPHDRALRRSRALLLVGAAIAALYVVAPFVIVALVLRYAEEGPWHGIGTVLTSLGVVGVVAVAAAAVALVAAAVATIAWRGIPKLVVRLAGARAPRDDEARLAAAAVEPFGLACGIHSPTVWIVDDRAPNACSFGSPNAAHVCFTTGALALPDDELASLAAFALTALSSRPFAYCTAAIDVTLLAESLTRLLWATAVLGFLSPIVGASAGFAVGFVLSVVGLVAVTRLVLFVTDRALPGLLDDAAEMVDLEAVRLTANPSAYSRLITHLMQDHHRVRSAWPIAHLWFERDEVEVLPRHAGLLGTLTAIAPVPNVARRYERANPLGLEERGQRALAQADGSVTPARRVASRARGGPGSAKRR